MGEGDREVLGEIERETRADKDTLEVWDKDRDPMGDKEAETEPMALDLEAKGLLDGVVAMVGVKAAGDLVPPLTLPPPPPPDLVGKSWVPVAAAPVPVEVGEGVCAAPLPDARLEGEGRVVAEADNVSAPLGVPLRVVSRAAVGVGAEAVCGGELEVNEEGEVVEVVEMEGEGLEVSAPLAVPNDDFEMEGEEEGVRVVEGVFDTSEDALSELEGLGERESLDLSETVAKLDGVKKLRVALGEEDREGEGKVEREPPVTLPASVTLGVVEMAGDREVLGEAVDDPVP